MPPGSRSAEGRLEVITGPMFSGKSEELIRRVNRALIARQEVLVCKPAADDRYHPSQVTSHSGRTAKAIPVAGTPELAAAWRSLEVPAQVIALDEVQFFGADLSALISEMVEAGVRVIAAGLDLDFRGEPFGVLPDLLARAEQIDKLSAICVVCGGTATRTQRLLGGEPADPNGPVVLVGASERYEARCRQHHQLVRERGALGGQEAAAQA